MMEWRTCESWLGLTVSLESYSQKSVLIMVSQSHQGPATFTTIHDTNETKKSEVEGSTLGTQENQK